MSLQRPQGGTEWLDDNTILRKGVDNAKRFSHLVLSRCIMRYSSIRSGGSIGLSFLHGGRTPIVSNSWRKPAQHSCTRVATAIYRSRDHYSITRASRASSLVTLGHVHGIYSTWLPTYTQHKLYHCPRLTLSLSHRALFGLHCLNTLASIIAEARKGLKSVSTKRPNTPGDAGRHLFGSHQHSTQQGPVKRPPSVYRWVGVSHCWKELLLLCIASLSPSVADVC